MHYIVTVDIDECASDVHECVENAICSNTNGSYDCECAEGYRGHGFMNCTGIYNTYTVCPVTCHCWLGSVQKHCMIKYRSTFWLGVSVYGSYV